MVKISETLDVSLKEALDMFYRSETCRRFHDEETGLYLQGNLYVLNDFLAEISACFRAGYNLYPSPNPLRLIAKTFAVHKNGRFYGRGLQNSAAVHEKGCFYG